MSRKITTIKEPKETNPGGSKLPKHTLSAAEVNDIRETIDSHAGDIEGIIGTKVPIEVELVTSTTPGKINVETGASTTSAESHMSGFIPTPENRKLIIAMRTDNFNASPPLVGTGIAGYSSANEGSFVKGLMGDDIYNALHGTGYYQHANYIDVEVIVPAGINFVRGSSMWNDPQGIPLSIRTLKTQGTAADSIGQLFERVNRNTTFAHSGESQSEVPVGPDFTYLDKENLDALGASALTFDGDGFIMKPDRGNGKTYRYYSLNGVLTSEEIAGGVAVKSLRGLPYKFGAAMDWDKVNIGSVPLYKEAFHDISLITPENGSAPSHIQNALAPGFTKYVPGAGSLAYNYTEIDNICSFAVTNGSKMHFAHYTWHYDPANAIHVRNIKTDYPDNYQSVYLQYLDEVASVIFPRMEAKYPGLFIGINVMNESANDTGASDPQKACFWKTVFPDLYVMFKAAFSNVTKYAPTWKRFYNDANFETGNMTRTNFINGLVDQLAAENIVINGKKVELDGIGMQMHTAQSLVTDSYNYSTLKSRMKYWSDKGKMVFISELDTSTPAQYTAVEAASLANFYTKILDAYEVSVLQALRYAVGVWPITDAAYEKNIGMNAPDSTTKPITRFPALYDWWGVKKQAYDTIVARVK